MSQTAYVGCAGWTIPREYAGRFPAEGSHLERYAQRLTAVEINSSFYKPHLPATYAKWAASVPDSFRFSVKMPREITHQRRLIETAEPLKRFLGEVASLGSALGPLLVQLPPSLAFNAEAATTFFETLRAMYSGLVTCEPRHPSWFAPESEQLLTDFQVARVAADPAPVSFAARPGGWPGLVYYRLHGSPRMYYSAYPLEKLEALSREINASARTVPTWCIFDNTALGAATADALTVAEK